MGNSSVAYIEVFDPTGKVEQHSIEASSGLAELNGKVIGLVDNGKPNYDIFLDRVKELLGVKFEFAETVHIKKGNNDTGAPLNADDINRLATRCDIVLNGICD